MVRKGKRYGEKERRENEGRDGREREGTDTKWKEIFSLNVYKIATPLLYKRGILSWNKSYNSLVNS